MANMWDGSHKGGQDAGTLPKGEIIGSYTSYLDAQRVVDQLADHRFPVQQVSIVGNDLKMIERVVGALSYPRVALSSAMTGAWFGLLIGMLLSFFSSANSQGAFPVIASVLMGAGFWMLFGVGTYAMQKGKRDFTSTNQVLASSFDVVVASEVLGEARRLLAQLPAEALPQTDGASLMNKAHDQGHQQRRPQGGEDPYPPKYGERAPEGPDSDRAPHSAGLPDLPDGGPAYGVRTRPQERPTDQK